jgi:endonuclease/exonuclease/phosphatase family metal-dependent hydrolase
MSFNIRWPMDSDAAERSWRRRRNSVITVIREHAPDVIGLQESRADQVSDLTEALPAYAAKNDGPSRTANTILFRRDRFRAVSAGSFDLANPPGLPGDRYGAWIRLTEVGSGRSFHVVNVHFDHRSKSSRDASARILMDHLASRPSDESVIITGDFNAPDHSAALRILFDQAHLIDTFRFRQTEGQVNQATAHHFTGTNIGPRVDYILVGSAVDVIDCRILRDRPAGIHPSDHFPVLARLRISASDPHRTGAPQHPRER